MACFIKGMYGSVRAWHFPFGLRPDPLCALHVDRLVYFPVLWYIRLY